MIVGTRWRIAALFIPVVLFPVVPTAAQSGTSTLTGLVQDATGGSLPGVPVHVVHEDTGVAVDTVTNEHGVYRVATLVPGTYRVEIALSGFAPVIRRPIRLEVGQTLAVDVTLDIEQRTEAVRVIADVPDLTIEKSIPLTARVKCDLRAGAYNLFNRVTFNLPGVMLGAADFGVISSARPARTLQLGARLTF